MKSKRGTVTPDPDASHTGPEDRLEGEPGSRENEGYGRPAGEMPHSLEEAQAEIERLRAREEELLRAVAEMTNVQRRRKLDSEQTVRYAQESLVRELLPVLDDFDRALAAMPGDPGDPVRAGIELVRDRLMKILEREGVVPIRPAGQPFDPNLHDAIGERVAPPDIPPGTVLDVAQAGYMLRDRVLRHAKVVVAGPPAITPIPPSMRGSDVPRPYDTIPPPLDERDRDA
jgi:molecular chaperone GrpE